MLEKLKAAVREFEKAPPGERFERRYRERKEDERPVRRVLLVVLGAGMIIAGIVMLAIPGPGILFVAAGGALIAREFLWAARLLDNLDVLFRKVLRRLEAFWKKASVSVRAAVVGAAAVLALGAAYVGYLVFIRQ